MKTILEITPTEKRSYEMPTDIYDYIQLALHMRWRKSVKSAVENLPEKWRSLVTVSTSPHEPAIRGKSAEILIDDIDGRAFAPESKLMEKLRIIQSGKTAILPTGEIVERGTAGAMDYESKP